MNSDDLPIIGQGGKKMPLDKKTLDKLKKENPEAYLLWLDKGPISFLRYFWALEQNAAAAFVVQELIDYHREVGFNAYFKKSVDKFLDKIPFSIFSKRTIFRTLVLLVEIEVLESTPTVRNTPKAYRINAEKLVERMGQVSHDYPGMTCREYAVGLNLINRTREDIREYGCSTRKKTHI